MGITECWAAVYLKNLDPTVQPLEFDSPLQLLIVVQPWASDSASLSLSFLLGKMTPTLLSHGAFKEVIEISTGTK